MKRAFIKLAACITMLALLVAVPALSACMMRDSGEAAVYFAVEFVSEGLESEYPIGSTITIPAAQIDLGGGTNVNATAALVIFPSGYATMSETVCLTEAGRYTVTYSAVANGKTVKGSVYFTVLRNAFRLSGKKSSAYYGTHANGETGVIMSVARNESFTYEPVIDFSDSTKANAFIRLSAPPSSPGVADASQIVLTLTDIYRPENRIKIYIKNLAHEDTFYNEITFITAETDEQPQVGIENGYAHRGDKFGTPVLFTPVGKSTMPITVNLELYLDYASKKLYASNPCYADEGLVCDLTELNYFDTPWQGFFDGKARLSISGASYNANAMNLVVSQIKGRDLSVLSVKDITPPMVFTDTGEYSAGNLPAAVTGKQYAVFPASAIDDYDGSVPVTAEVYYNYWSNNKGIVNIINGRFTPTNPGMYTIVYTAADITGNQSVETLDIVSNASAGNFSFTLTDKFISGNLGGDVQICSGVTPQNSSGIIKYSAEAEHILTGKKYAVDTTTWKFFPMDAGTYRVTVKGSDYLSSHTEIFDFNMSNGVAPVITAGIVLPKYFVKNATYTLPDVYGYDFSSGSAVSVKAAVVIKQDGGGELTNAAPGGRYKVGASSTVRVIYRVTAGGNSTDKFIDVPVVDAGYTGSANANINMLSYFQTVNGSFSKSADSNRVMFTANAAGSFEFINALQVNHNNGFELYFAPLDGSTAMSAVSVYLTDAEDPSVSVRFRYGKVSGDTAFSLNNEISSYNLDFNFASHGSQVFRMTYKNASKTVNPVPGRSIEIKTDLSGKPFGGFKSGRVYLKMEAEYAQGTSGQSVVCVSKINNQAFYNDNRDRNEPQIIAFSAKGDRSLGETLLLPASYAADVLDPDVTYTLTVRRNNASGPIITSADGIALNAVNPGRDYEIILSELGEYRIYYTAVDKNNNSVTFNYGVTVKDMVPPVITLTNITNTAKAGSTVTVASASVSKGTVTVYYETPDAVLIKITDGKFTAEKDKTGIYTVHYYAADSSGNYAVASYQIAVS